MIKMHKFKTKNQRKKDGQLQGWHLNLARMQLNWFLKSKSQLRTGLNKSKIKDRFENWHFLTPFSFQWNDMFCTKRHCFTHCSFFLKKELKTVLFSAIFSCLSILCLSSFVYVFPSVFSSLFHFFVYVCLSFLLYRSFLSVFVFFFIPDIK
jgi:hypothetical protein